MLKGTRKTRKDQSLSITTGTDVFGPTDVNTMVVDQDETAEVSFISLGRSAMTNVTHHVHPAPQMMPLSHVLVGVTGSTPMPKKSIDHNVNMLRVDIGCTAGLNISCLSTTSCTSGYQKWPSNRSNIFSLWLLLREGLT